MASFLMPLLGYLWVPITCRGSGREWVQSYWLQWASSELCAVSKEVGTLTKPEISSVDSGCQEITERIRYRKCSRRWSYGWQHAEKKWRQTLCFAMVSWIALFLAPTEEVKIFIGSKLSLSCVLIFAKSHPHFCDWDKKSRMEVISGCKVIIILFGTHVQTH